MTKDFINSYDKISYNNAKCHFDTMSILKQNWCRIWSCCTFVSSVPWSMILKQHKKPEARNYLQVLVWWFSLLRNFEVWNAATYQLQFHMIFRINDTTQIVMDRNWIHNHFVGALETSLKSVQDNRDALRQNCAWKYESHLLCHHSFGIVARIFHAIKCMCNEFATPFAFSDYSRFLWWRAQNEEFSEDIFGQKSVGAGGF